jgi:flagellar biosynthesis/type III secretory pathway M-ring protein FliF/YscJ
LKRRRRKKRALLLLLFAVVAAILFALLWKQGSTQRRLAGAGLGQEAATVRTATGKTGGNQPMAEAQG